MSAECPSGLRLSASYLVGVWSEEQQVEGNGGHQVDQEPAPEVVHRYLARVRHHLVVRVDVRRAEVDEDVDDERHVNWNETRAIVDTSWGDLRPPDSKQGSNYTFWWDLFFLISKILKVIFHRKVTSLVLDLMVSFVEIALP